jgi:hypothetical protein
VVAILVLAWTSLGLFGIAFWPVVLAHGPGRLVRCGPVGATPRRETVLDEISPSISTSVFAHCVVSLRRNHSSATERILARHPCGHVYEFRPSAHVRAQRLRTLIISTFL